MMSYLLFAGLGFLIYMSAALAEAAMTRFGDAYLAFERCAAPCREARDAIAEGESRASATNHNPQSLFATRKWSP